MESTDMNKQTASRLEGGESNLSNHSPQRALWKSFCFDHGSYLLYIPTSHIISVNKQLAEQVARGEVNQPELVELVASFPEPPVKKIDPIEISAIALNVEESCNLRCTYCYAGDGNYGADTSMTFPKAKEILEHLAGAQERFHIQFFGGEPLLNFSLIREIVLWCKENSATRFSFSITTNGVLLRDSIMAFLKEHRFSMTLSYDGKGVQEEQRKTKNSRSSGKLVRSKIEKYAKDFKELTGFTLRATISNTHVQKLESAMLDSLKSFDLSFAASRAAVDKFGNAYSSQDVDQLITANENVVNYFLGIEDYESILKLSKIRFFIKMLHHGRINQNACTAGLSYLSVSTSGGFYLCHRFTEDEGGKVGDYKSGIDMQKLDEIRQHRLAKQEPCNSCWMKNWCGGGCYHENRSATGSLTEIDPDFCRIQDSEISLAMKCYTKILNERADLLD